MNAGPEVKNIVLVHGGFVDGSGWQGVYDHLTADGYRVAVVQNPTLSLAGLGAHLLGVATTDLRRYGVSRYYLSSPVTNTRSQPDGKPKRMPGPPACRLGCYCAAACHPRRRGDRA